MTGTQMVHAEVRVHLDLTPVIEAFRHIASITDEAARQMQQLSDTWGDETGDRDPAGT